MNNQEIQQQETSALAVASLILSSIGIFTGVMAIPGIICGHLAIKGIKENSNLKGVELAKKGLIIGYIVLTILVYLTIIVFVAPSGDMEIESQEIKIENRINENNSR